MVLPFFIYYPFVLILCVYNQIIYVYHKSKHCYQSDIKKQNVPSLHRGRDNFNKKLFTMAETKFNVTFCFTVFSNNNKYTIKFCGIYSHTIVFSSFYFGMNSYA